MNQFITVNKNTLLEGDTLLERIEFLVKNYSSNFHIKIKNIVCQINWFDGTSSYKDFYYNNNIKGLVLNVILDNNIITSIECGDKMIVNYILSKYYNKETKILMELYYLIAKLIGYEKFIIYDTFKNYDSKDVFKINKKYNKTLLTYFKEKKFILDKYSKRSLGNLKLKIFFNQIDKELNQKYGKAENHKLSDLYEYVKENNYFYLNKIHNYMLDNLGKEIFETIVNAKQYWIDNNEDFTSYSIEKTKELEYDTSFNRRRSR